MPAAQRLLPLYKNSSTKPASIFDFQLTVGILDCVRQGKKLKVVVKDGEMFLKVDNDKALVKLNKSITQDNRSTIYKQFSLSTFKNLGQVTASLTAEESSNALASTLEVAAPEGQKEATTLDPQETQSSQSQPQKVSTHETVTHTAASRRLRYLLSLGPMSFEDIVAKTKGMYPEHEIKKAIDMVGLPALQDDLIKEYPNPKPISLLRNGEYWVLDYRFYIGLKFIESRMFDMRSKLILMKNCQIVFDALNIPQEDNARLYLESARKQFEQPSQSQPPPTVITPTSLPSPSKTQSTNNAASTPTASYGRRGSVTRDPYSRHQERRGEIHNKQGKPIKRDTAKADQSSKSLTKSGKDQPRTRENSTKPESLVKQKSVSQKKGADLPITVNDVHNTKKRRRADGHDEQYYKDLANRFKEEYKEYSLLHHSIANDPKKAPADQLKKLQSLHRKLESWKKQLWESSTDKATSS